MTLNQASQQENRKNQIIQCIRTIPKCELHLHIEGTLEPELLFKLAKRNKIPLRFQSIDDLKEAYQFSCLQEFLDIYYEGAKVLVTEEDFYDLAWAYLEQMKRENVIHVEIFFDPQTHTERGVTFSTVIHGLSHALRDAETKLHISSRLIMCFLRHLSEEDGLRTLEEALPFQEMITAVGLDSSEKSHPPEKFLRLFERARRHGFLTVAHAGEEGPPEYIDQALELLRVSRIDHGVRCLEDPAVVNKLRDRKIPLTVCPLSNVKLGVFPGMTEHNLKRLLHEGLCVTVNSDDPAYFGGYLTENYTQVITALNLNERESIQIVRNGFEASFLDKKRKSQIQKAIDDHIADKKIFI